MTTVRITIADDHAVVRQGLRLILESHPGWKVFREASNGRQAVELVRQEPPDIVVMDVNMPDLNGIEATRQICKDFPSLPVLILSAHDSEQLVREMLIAGARGYVLKADAGEDLIAAVEALLVGRVFFTSSVSEFVMRSLREKSEAGAGSELPSRVSPREREVIQLLAEGCTNKETARRLEISVKTVETHRKNIMDKLGLKSLSELVRYAIHNQIISS